MTITPMMAQYLEIKQAHPGAILFYRMGDFYEMFFDDAIAAAEALDIALTKRGKHDGADIPMCGVPVHSAEGYLLSLIRKGFRVAVCEQLESPAEAKKRGYKAVVKRDVVRIVTPGTLTEDSLLDAKSHNYLAAFSLIRDSSALAWLDMSTGELSVMEVSQARLGAELARLAPAELLVSPTNFQSLGYLEDDFAIPLTEMSPTAFDSSSASKRLCETYQIASLDAFGTFSRSEIGALGALVGYVSLTQKGKLPKISPPQKQTVQSAVQIDAATRRNLELTRSLTDKRAGSLLSVIDQTQTSAGARLLEHRLSTPSTDVEKIDSWQQAVAVLLQSPQSLSALRSTLKEIPDIERALTRLSLDRGGPRDLGSIRTALSRSETIVAALDQAQSESEVLAEAVQDLRGQDGLLNELSNTLIEDLPLLTRDGGFVATGVSEELDDARLLRDEGKSIIASLQQQYQALTKVNSLKVKHNNVLGYFVETPATHAAVMMAEPLSETFIHRQTTANQVRFTTVELSDLENKIRTAGDRAIALEKTIFENMRAAVLDKAAVLQVFAKALASIDVHAGLAALAQTENWVRPKVDNSRAFHIQSGRHPVVEAALTKQNGFPFIANSCDLSAADHAANIWLLTGPNMAGKSTFLRQNALIAILAQMGSYVPADAAHIGIVSQIFSRVGASDDLARGRSTFMVEMVETAAILNQSDDRALVILDEIGRGTATYDGLSIAWATLEHLHEVNKCRGLFATHYHELTALSSDLPGVDNATVAVKEHDGEVVFLHEVRMGAADRSYGVQVARLAGLPPQVIARAQSILAKLEDQSRGNAGIQSLTDDLPLFSALPSDPEPAKATSQVLDLLGATNPDELSPRDALDLIYRLKGAADEG